MTKPITDVLERLDRKIESHGAWMTSDLREFYTELHDIIEAQAKEIERLTARIGATINVIESGYPGQPAKTEKCQHDRYGFEDCIACYDEALMSALTKHPVAQKDGA